MDWRGRSVQTNKRSAWLVPGALSVPTGRSLDLCHLDRHSLDSSRRSGSFSPPGFYAVRYVHKSEKWRAKAYSSSRITCGIAGLLRSHLQTSRGNPRSGQRKFHHDPLTNRSEWDIASRCNDVANTGSNQATTPTSMPGGSTPSTSSTTHRVFAWVARVLLQLEAPAVVLCLPGISMLRARHERVWPDR